MERIFRRSFECADVSLIVGNRGKRTEHAAGGRIQVKRLTLREGSVDILWKNI